MYDFERPSVLPVLALRMLRALLLRAAQALWAPRVARAPQALGALPTKTTPPLHS